MLRTKLVVRDHVNCAFVGLDPAIRRKICDALKFTVPGAKYTPQYKLGRWDGTVSYCTISGGTYLNLLDRILPIIMDAGYEIDIDDRRPTNQFSFPEPSEQMFADRSWPLGHQLAGEPIILRDYQVEAIRRFLANLQSVQELSTGSGKTALVAALSSIIEPYGRSIVIVPNKSLVRQTAQDYRNLGLDVGLFYGEKKEWGHKHTIATWQSLASLAKKKSGDETIGRFVEDVTCVMVDECHSISGSVLRNLLCGALAFIPIRWGLTGTIPKEEHEKVGIIASIGDVVGKVRAAELQSRAVLADCQVDIVQLHDNHVGFRDYDSEHMFLVTDNERMTYVASLINDISESGNTLVLVDRIEAGEILQLLLPGSAFVYGNTKTALREQQYRSVQHEDCKIIIATYGVAAVGIDMPRLFNLVLLEAGKSFIRTIQSVGRGLRKAKDKDYIRIIDICSSLYFSNRHLGKRKRYYAEAQYPHVVRKVNYR
jgi:superfamily II DNA or RNA helicase